MSTASNVTNERSILVDEIITEVRNSTLFREDGAPLKVKESVLRTILARHLAELARHGGRWSIVVGLPESITILHAEHVREARETLPACRCGQPAATGTLVERWQGISLDEATPNGTRWPRVSPRRSRIESAATPTPVPCPWCGPQKRATPVVMEFEPENGAHSEFWVACSRCSARGPSVCNKVEAIVRWNRRYAQPAEPQPADAPARKCVQTVNRFGHPMGVTCDAIKLRDRHGDCRSPATDALMRICRHHDYLPEPLPSSPSKRAGVVWICVTHHEFGTGCNWPTAAAAAKGHSMPFDGDCVILLVSADGGDR